MIYKNICVLYEYFYCEVSGNKMFSFEPKQNQKKQIENFIKKIPKSSVGENWLFDFFLFQFNRYRNKKTRFGVGIVQLNWVIGKKALDVWHIRTAEQEFTAKDFKLKYEIKNPLIVKKKHTLNSNYKDTIRANKNIILCEEMSLYNKSNIICMKCKKCKQ